MKIRFSLIVITLLMLYDIHQGTVFALTPTEQEYRQLPPYCQMQKFMAIWRPGYQATPQNDAVNNRNHALWEAKMGSGTGSNNIFYHMHHWCWALVGFNRYYSDFKSPNRKGYLEQAIGDIDYVLQHSHDSDSILPEILTRRGKIYSILKKSGQAAADFTRAIKLKPKYGLAYVYYSDLYRESGQKDEAITIIKAGLAADPKSDLLQKQLQRLK